MIRRYCSLGSNLFCLFSTNILTHPFPGGFRYQNQRAPVVDVDQTFIGRRRNNQKAFRFVAALKGCTADRGHKYWLAIFAVYEVGLLLIAFLYPLEPAVSKTNRPAMLP
ncbi:Uncharacterised protein [Raoultella terrigena]|nr:Uncharacterised protein [Raoultella terrigena]